MDDLNKSAVLVHVRPARIAQTARQAGIEELTALAAKPGPRYGASPQLEALLALQDAQDRIPDPFLAARAVDNVVIERGGTIIRPTSQAIRPLKIESAAGVSREVNEADFFFPFAAFETSSDITLVIISGDRTEKYVITSQELKMMQ